MKADNIHIGPFLNEELWKHGIKNPPHHVKIKTKKTAEVVVAELAGKPLPDLEKKKEEEKSKIRQALEKLKGKAPGLEAKVGVKEEKAEKREVKKEEIKEEPKAEATPEVKKEETKPEEKKVEAKVEEKKEETKPEEKKEEEKKEEPKVEEKKVEKPKVEAKAEATPEEKKEEAKPAEKPKAEG